MPPTDCAGLGTRKLRARGFSLSEVIILLMLVSIAIIPIMGLFPFGRLALKKAEDLQSAVFLARQSMSLARATVCAHLTDPPLDSSVPASHAVDAQTINGITYTIARDIYSVQAAPDPDDNTKTDVVLMDVVVKVEWPTMRVPLLYSSRIYRNYLDLQKNVNTQQHAPTPVPQ